MLARLRQGPVRARVRHPITAAVTEVDLTEEAFVDAVRVTMYSGERGREVPFLVAQANAGDFDSLAETTINASRGMYTGAPFGLYYAVTCNEFVNRIRRVHCARQSASSNSGTDRVHRWRP